MQQARVDFARPLFFAQITDGVNTANQRDESGQPNHQCAQCICAEEPAKGLNRAARQHFRPEPYRQRGDDGEGEQIEPLQHGALTQRPANQADE